MTVTKHLQRKLVQVQFSVDGLRASVSTAPSETNELIERKEVANHGHADLYFPADFTGECYVAVQGSKPGSAPDAGTITVE